PASAEIETDVVDRGGLRPGAVRAEEEHVGRLEPCEAEALGAWDLAAHRVGGPAAERGLEARPHGVGSELVDPPDESGAIEASGNLDSQRRLGVLARPCPDVWVADQGHRLP